MSCSTPCDGPVTHHDSLLHHVPVKKL